MNTVSTTIRTRTAAFRIPRLVAVLALAIALVAIPTFVPADASAQRMSETGASRACRQAGGEMTYIFLDMGLRSYNMLCEFPSGNSFVCSGHSLVRFVSCGGVE